MRKHWIRLTVLAAAAAVLTMGATAADVYNGSKSVIDATHAADGYVTIHASASNPKRLKVIIEKGAGKYQYDLDNTGKNEIYTFQMGDGSYKVRVLENTTDNRYATLQTVDLDVKLKSQFAPFLVTNQFVEYTSKSTAVTKAVELTKSAKTQLEKVDSIYAFVTKALTYDDKKAQSASSGSLNGYLPDVDAVLSAKKGICFDYAALMAAMLRSQGIPTKLVTGYVTPNGAYHAWNEIYLSGVGWVTTGKLYFDGKSWSLADATFLSSANSSSSIVKYIGNGSNYTTKYVY